MTEPCRFRYRIDLTAHRPRIAGPRPGIIVRSPSRADIGMLARLMLDSYRDTIDYGGQGIEEAMQADPDQPISDGGATPDGG